MKANFSDPTGTPPDSAEPGHVPWQQALPVLRGQGVTLRELELADAPALLYWFTIEDVFRYISGPPDTQGGFERFVFWMHQERAAGRALAYAVVPDERTTMVGMFQLRGLDEGLGTIQWGFALGQPYWGTGVFMEAARLVLDFAFDVLHAHRIEARAAQSHGRGHGALMKLGAVRECLLRRSLQQDGRYVDEILWSILVDDWRQARTRERIQSS